MEKFYLGLDIGTNSVGIACTDENYNLLRAKGNDLWAVRLFDEAKPASDRRMQRATRRRLMRRRKRIELLQELLAPLMAQKDDKFFLRLNNSPYMPEDKRGADSKYVIFADDDYNDVNFYREYPTIYHLRSALVRGEAKKDIRLYYLAMHHILKYRGNFLFEGQKLSEIRDVVKVFERLNESVTALYGDDGITFDTGRAEAFKVAALSRGGIKARTNKCCEALGVKDDAGKNMVSLMVGGSVKAAKLFGGDRGEISAVCFKKLEDEKFEAFAADLSEEEFDLLVSLRAVYNYITFENVLGGYRYISDAIVALYDKHAQDLKKLKALLHPNKTLYNMMFRAVSEKEKKEDKKDEDGEEKEDKKKKAIKNYSAYVGFSKVRGDKKEKCKRCVDADEFYKYVKSVITAHRGELDEKLADEVLADIEDGTFMPRPLNADNGVFPYQVNESELAEILKNAERDFPEFLEESEGCTLSEKIMSVLKFRIPYYVGPLNTHHEQKVNGKGGNSWMVRKEEGRITPWNFDEKVDRAKSNDKFMRRMTNKCAYLHGKDVLPKCSILYQKFDTLNQINKLTVNGIPVSVEIKQRVFNDLFLREKRVTFKRIRNYFAEIGYISESEKNDTVVSCGKNEDLKASMSTYVTLRNRLGDLVDTNEDMCEDIVLWHTLNTDKNIVGQLISEKYGDLPEVRENLKFLKGLNFKDFGKLSKELLCETPGGVDENTGEVYTIIGELYKTNMNFNELLWSDRYEFRKSIDEENGAAGHEVGYEDVESLYVSPAVRRGIWQALVMCDEYTTALGRKPDKVFVEVTRSKGKKEPTESRKKKLEKLYAGCTGIDDLKQQLSGMTDFNLRQERLYLYFRQLGKCMYSGDKIELDALMSDSYDVDHIIPRSLSKDDSLENKVLVSAVLNRYKKKNTYPVPESCRPPKAVELWNLLKAKELISGEKFDRLMRTNPLTQEELEAFENRQIVFTGQAAKAVAELLKRKYETEDGGSVVYYSKASAVSDFRKKFRFDKCRDTNDLHHARDAYLNIVVGNVYNVRFASLYLDKKRGKPISVSAEDDLYAKPIYGAWQCGKTLSTVHSTMNKFSMCVTKYSYKGKGAFYDQTVYPATDGGIGAPRKGKGPLSDTQKYGGYKTLNTAYFSVVSHIGKKKERIKTIEAVPVLAAYGIGDDAEKLRDYFVSKGLADPVVLVPVVKKYSLIRYNGTPVLITGITGKQIILHHAVQWFTDGGTDAYVKALQKFKDGADAGQLSGDESELEVNKSRVRSGIKINTENNLALYDKMISQLGSTVYGGLSGAANFLKNIREKREKFLSISLDKQVKTLLEMVKFLGGGKGLSDMTAIGLSAHSGMLLISQNITDAKVEFIHRSPCGLHTVIRRV